MESVMSANGLKYFKRLKIWKSSTGNVKFDPTSVRATSYNWWVFVRKIKGKVVFNDYNYSPSTGGHQNAVRALLKKLKINIDVTIKMRSSLNDLTTESLPAIYKEIFTLKAYNVRKGVRKATIQYNLERISDLRADMKIMRSLGAEITRYTLEKLKQEVSASETWHANQLVEKRKAARLYRAEKKLLLDNSFLNVA